MEYFESGTAERGVMSLQNKEYTANTKGWKIKTKDGFVPFGGVKEMGIKHLYNVTFDDNTHIEVTHNHRFFTVDGREIETKELMEGIELLGIENKTVKSITSTKVEQTYDIIDVQNSNHSYFANGILCHNCEFISSDALLMDSIWINNETERIKQQQPVNIVKDVIFFAEIKPNTTYIVGVDPSTGSGEDYGTITMFEFPSMIQIGEWRSNTMSSNKTYGVLKNILRIFEKLNCTVYFSVENNGVGEGIMALYEADENPPETAEMISEEGKSRRGITTTPKSKMKACVNMKEMMEKGKMIINSPVLIAELKSYIRYRGAYAAQKGATDDVISAVLIIMRILEEIATYEQEAFDKLYSSDYSEWGEDEFSEYDEGDEGLPMVF